MLAIAIISVQPTWSPTQKIGAACIVSVLMLGFFYMAYLQSRKSKY